MSWRRARNILKVWPALWAFDSITGVQPTNNHANVDCAARSSTASSPSAACARPRARQQTRPSCRTGCIDPTSKVFSVAARKTSKLCIRLSGLTDVGGWRSCCRNAERAHFRKRYRRCRPGPAGSWLFAVDHHQDALIHTISVRSARRGVPAPHPDALEVMVAGLEHAAAGRLPGDRPLASSASRGNDARQSCECCASSEPHRRRPPGAMPP